MYQKDYILRMIEMLGELLRAMFGMIKKRQFTQAEESIGEAYLTMLRKDSAFFQEIPADKLTKTLLEDHNYTHQHLEILAELMYAEAELNYARNKISDSLPFYQKSLVLFEFVDDAYRTWSEDRIKKINKIRERLFEGRGEMGDGETGKKGRRGDWVKG
ncbi:MAG TPA: hypothetical protein VK179_04250 [Bacteroidales bacterium]|nr:hypothetical protein [Bacteroidales bacterium]